MISPEKKESDGQGCGMRDNDWKDEYDSVISATLNRFRLTSCDKEDVAQNVRIAFIRTPAHEFLKIKSIHAWITGATTKHALMFLRTDRRWHQRTRDLANHLLTEQNDTKSSYNSCDRSELMQKAMVQLHDNDRTILIAKYCDSKSVLQIAEELCLPYLTVQTKLNTARNRLRKKYQFQLSCAEEIRTPG